MGFTARLILVAKRHWGTLAVACPGIIRAALFKPGDAGNCTAADGFAGTARRGQHPAAGAVFPDFGGGVPAAGGLPVYQPGHQPPGGLAVCAGADAYRVRQAAEPVHAVFHDKQTGELMSRMINDTRQIEILVAHALPDLVSNVLIVVSVAVMLFCINWQLALLTLIPVPLVVLGGRAVFQAGGAAEPHQPAGAGELNGVLQDNLSGMKEIQTLPAGGTEHEKMVKRCKRYSEVNIRANFANAFFNPAVEFLTSPGHGDRGGAGGFMASRQAMPVSDVVGFLMYLSLFYQPRPSWPGWWRTQMAYASAVRVFDVLDAESEVKEEPDAGELEAERGEVSSSR